MSKEALSTKAPRQALSSDSQVDSQGAGVAGPKAEFAQSAF